jgi:hypothetical protein
MRTTPAQLILAVGVATLFGFAGVASRTCSVERSGPELLPGSARGAPEAPEALSSAPAFDARSLDTPPFDPLRRRAAPPSGVIRRTQRTSRPARSGCDLELVAPRSHQERPVKK